MRAKWSLFAVPQDVQGLSLAPFVPQHLGFEGGLGFKPLSVSSGGSVYLQPPSPLSSPTLSVSSTLSSDLRCCGAGHVMFCVFVPKIACGLRWPFALGERKGLWSDRGDCCVWISQCKKNRQQHRLVAGLREKTPPKNKETEDPQPFPREFFF